MQRDSVRTRVWFPLFSYFEATVDGIVPNEYDTPAEIICNLVSFLKMKLSSVTNYGVLISNTNSRNNINGRLPPMANAATQINKNK